MKLLKPGRGCSGELDVGLSGISALDRRDQQIENEWTSAAGGAAGEGLNNLPWFLPPPQGASRTAVLDTRAQACRVPIDRLSPRLLTQDFGLPQTKLQTSSQS